MKNQYFFSQNAFLTSNKTHHEHSIGDDHNTLMWPFSSKFPPINSNKRTKITLTP